MNGREIYADNLRVRELVAHLDGPKTSSGGDVQDLPWRITSGPWGQIIPTIQHDLDDVVLVVQPVVFQLVVWENVRWTIVRGGVAERGHEQKEAIHPARNA